MTPEQPPRTPSPAGLPADHGEPRGRTTHSRRSDPQSTLPGEGAGNPGRPPSPLPAPYRAGSRGSTPGCTRSQEGRVLPNRHHADCPGPPCTGCEPCPEPHCHTCGTAHAPTTCPTCLHETRDHLHELADLSTRLQTEATTGRQAYRTHEEIPGGDALVMLVAAATLRGRGGNPIHLLTRYELPTDPRPPLDVLTFWEHTWRVQSGQETTDPPTMDTVVAYLDAQLHRIAESPIFPRLHRDLRRAVHTTENVLHEGHRPEVSRVPCLECGTRVLKVYADAPRHDHWRCPTCGEQYDKGRYERALHAHLASKGAARYVPISDASAASGRGERTVRDWVRREVVDATRDPASGRLLVWWPDVREAHLDKQTRGGTR